MKKFLSALILSSFLVLSACSTSRGLAPVEKFFTETNGNTYREALDTGEHFENADKLKAEFDLNKQIVIDTRKKTYTPFSRILGDSFEEDLIPVDNFLNDESGDIFAYGKWVEKEYENEKIIDVQRTTRLNELESIKALVHKLATGKD